MTNRFGFLADHLVEFSDECSCGSGGFSPHEQYCGVEPVMTVQDLTDFVDAPVGHVSPGMWRNHVGSDLGFEVYVSTQDNSVKFSRDKFALSADEALSLAGALARAAAYSKQQEAAGE